VLLMFVEQHFRQGQESDRASYTFPPLRMHAHCWHLVKSGRKMCLRLLLRARVEGARVLCECVQLNKSSPSSSCISICTLYQGFRAKVVFVKSSVQLLDRVSMETAL
jgi:hypothetical protein